jgi:hypothetical protein
MTCSRALSTAIWREPARSRCTSRTPTTTTPLTLSFLQCIEFDCRRNCGAAALTPSPRINAVPAIFMRETHYIGRYDGEGIDFACPRLVVELPSCSVATPSSLLAALASAEFSGFSDVRFTAELWEQPPTTPAGDFNVMTHAWMFGHLNLAEKLKNNSDIIIGAFEPIGIDASPAAAARPPARAGGGPATATGGDNKHALRINSISRSRVSLHMKWGSPAFSPNNCKLRLKNGSGLSSFWLLKGDPATRRAMVSFICLLPPASSAAFVDVMSQQRQCASSAPDAPPGAARVSLHTLLSCLQSHPSVSDAAAALGAVLIASDDDASLCVAPHGSTAAPLQQSTEPSENTGGAGAAQQGPPSAGGCGSAQLQLSPGAIHDAIKGERSCIPAGRIPGYFCLFSHCCTKCFHSFFSDSADSFLSQIFSQSTRIWAWAR